MLIGHRKGTAGHTPAAAGLGRGRLELPARRQKSADFRRRAFAAFRSFIQRTAKLFINMKFCVRSKKYRHSSHFAVT